jgi:sugar transferase (PEP-CTERM/EpsH1 system associated)
MVNDTSVQPGTSKPDLLLLTQRIPYPPNKGEKIRHFQILKHLAESYNVYLGCLVDDPDDWQHIETVKSFCADVYVARLDRRFDALSHLKALATGEALSVALYRHRPLAEWVSRTLETVRPDIVFVCSSNMAPYVMNQAHRGRRRIVDLVDVDSEKWRAYAGQAFGPMKWLYRREARLVFALERQVAHQADYSTFVSDAEADMFRRLVPDRAGAIVGISNGVDCTYFDPDGGFAAPYNVGVPNFVFTGTMDYVPNIDAVTWFANEIFPVIRRNLPDAQFHIVGANPAPAVRNLTRIKNVYVTGRVPDVRPYLAHATAAVAPMRIARGIQNKVLEAMAMARPVIVTSDALEGIEAAPGSELLLANAAVAFAIAAYRLTSDVTEGRKIGEAARRRVVADFSWEGRLRGFDRLLRTEP